MLIQKPFYYARHGETVHNHLGIYAGGSIDTPLTERGIAQAQALKVKISTLPIKHVISSPLIRAKNTAEIAWPHEIHLEDGLKELHMGIYAGKNKHEVSSHIFSLPYDTAIPHGESRKEFAQRVIFACNRWLLHCEGTPLFVAHGLVYHALLESIGKEHSHLDNSGLVYFTPNLSEWDVIHL